MKKIGFTASEEDEQNEDKEQLMLIEMINVRYGYTGERYRLCYKTSREIVYELREMINTTIKEVSIAMRKAGYQTKIIGDLPHWEMYDYTISKN